MCCFEILESALNWAGMMSIYSTFFQTLKIFSYYWGKKSLTLKSHCTDSKSLNRYFRKRVIQGDFCAMSNLPPKNISTLIFPASINFIFELLQFEILSNVSSFELEQKSLLENWPCWALVAAPFLAPTHAMARAAKGFKKSCYVEIRLISRPFNVYASFGA